MILTNVSRKMPSTFLIGYFSSAGAVNFVRSAQFEDSFLETFVFFFACVAKSRRFYESDDSFLSVINAGEFRVD